MKMGELLSLKWKNHSSAFLQLLGTIRTQQMYSDVTLACSGKFYCAHRIILTACSDYFKEIFEHLDTNKPVVVLKDIDCDKLEALLDYMYVGEVSVKQSDLPTLIKAAECLCIKGLAVAEDEPSERPPTPPRNAKRKRTAVESNNGSEPSSRKKLLRSVPQTLPRNNGQESFASAEEEYSDDKSEVVLVPDQITIKDEPTEIDIEKVEIVSNSFDDISESSYTNMTQLQEGASTSAMSTIQKNFDEWDPADPDLKFASPLTDFDESNENGSRPQAMVEMSTTRNLNVATGSLLSIDDLSDVAIGVGFQPSDVPVLETEENKQKKGTKRGKKSAPKTQDLPFLQCNCRFKCEVNLTYVDRKIIHAKFWCNASWQTQSNFILSTVLISAPQRRTVLLPSRKSYSRKYFLLNKQICQRVYTSTLGITADRVNYLFNKKERIVNGLCYPDMRGRVRSKFS